jgi:hypothetical protein
MPLDAEDALRKLQDVPQRFQKFSQALNSFGRFINGVLRATGALLGIFILHQLFFWLSSDPERAFDYAAQFLEIVEICWDLFGLAWNPLSEIANSAILPLWNGFTFYIVEPAIFTVLEAFSLIFLRQNYKGFISESALPYGGFSCDPTDQVSMAWCGRASAYDARLAASTSQTAESSIVLGPETARRLAETGGLDFDIPVIDLTDLIVALDGLTTQAIVMVGSLADLFFGIAFNLVETSVVFVFDAAWTIVKTVFDLLKLIVKSGMLQTILGIGIDFIIIMIVEIGVPLLTAAIDAVVCVFQFFLWKSWGEQLRCADAKCFRGPDASSDWIIFTSIPAVTARFGGILEATLNSNTGKSFSGGQSFDLGISDLGSLFPATETASECAACFVCKFPEFRFLWLGFAATISTFNADNFNKFHGNVSETCMTNGSFYTDVLCGPRTDETLNMDFAQWSSLYKAGYADFDPELVEAYATKMRTRSEELGGAAGGQEGELTLEAANAWFERNAGACTGPDFGPDSYCGSCRDQLTKYKCTAASACECTWNAGAAVPFDKAAARFTYFMCRLMRESPAGLQEDESPQRYSEHAVDSLSYITSQWAYDSCRRFKHTVFGAISRAAHDTALEVSMCIEGVITPLLSALQPRMLILFFVQMPQEKWRARRTKNTVSERARATKPAIFFVS